MITVLVTGAIGSGKSALCRYLETKGYPVYDCDARTKLLYEAVPDLKCTIESALGIKWSQIGIIFSDRSKRQKLEDIVYPYLVEDIMAWKAEQTGNLVFIESAIALDKPILNSLYDKVLLIRADYQTRLARNPKVAQRDSLQQFDLARVDYTIDNDSSLEDLYILAQKYIDCIDYAKGSE